MVRSKPITGYVLDSAGNVIRYGVVEIKNKHGVLIDTVNCDSSGYFETRPLPTGDYYVFNNSVLVSDVLHRPDNTIECFRSLDTEKPNFTNDDLTKYITYIQIEPNTRNVKVDGSLFPIYDMQFKDSQVQEFSDFADKYGMTEESRITSTRFDVEYYTNGKLLRFTNIPAIRYTNTSRLVIPLDYSSISRRLPILLSGSQVTEVSTTDAVIVLGNISGTVKRGDIVMIQGQAEGDIYTGICSRNDEVRLDPLPETTYVPSVNDTPDIVVYEGMGEMFDDIGDYINEFVSVFENIEAQN